MTLQSHLKLASAPLAIAVLLTSQPALAQQDPADLPGSPAAAPSDHGSPTSAICSRWIAHPAPRP